MLHVHDFTFEQSETHVYISVKWPFIITATTADIYANEVYVKVHAAPYLFELDLAHKVVDDASSVEISSDAVARRSIVVFSMLKKHQKPWASASLAAMSRVELRARRENAERAFQARREFERSRKAADDAERRRAAVKMQLEVERAARDKIADAKAALAAEAAADILDRWPSTNCLPIDGEEPELVALRQKMAELESSGCKNASSRQPPPRQPAELKVQFTQRSLTTAARESQDERILAQVEENKIKRTAEMEAESKARELVRQGDFARAADAFSACSELAPKNHRCYVGRSECFEKLSEWNCVIDDCDVALGLISATEKNLQTGNLYDEIKDELRARKARALQMVSSA